MPSETVMLTSGTVDGNAPQNQSVSRKAAVMSKLIDSMLADDEDGDNEVPEIPLLEISSSILAYIVAFLEYHANDPMKDIPKPIATNVIEDIVGKWDADFINQFEQDVLFKMILAANYLDIPCLLDLGICKIACMVKGKEPDEVKKMFNIEPDITPEEEKRVRSENSWIFEVNSQ